MGYPHPDLEIRNTTPYGVLIWPSYTGTTLTITLYSTKYYTSVTQSGQTESKRGSCTVVRTERTRVSLDGRSKVDNVRATYRAREGLDCSDPVPAGPPPTTAPATTAPGTTAPPAPPTTTP
jgi:vancomycin resistance protein YoaR